MQRFAGTGENVEIFGLDAFHLSESLDEFFLEPVGIAAALRGHIHDGFARGVARAEGIFVGVNHDGARMKHVAVFRGEGGFGGDAEGHRRGGGRNVLREPSESLSLVFMWHSSIVRKSSANRSCCRVPATNETGMVHPARASL